MNEPNKSTSALIPGPFGRLLARLGLYNAQLHEREWLFFSSVLILTLGHSVFAAISWQLNIEGGVLTNVMGMMGMLLLASLRLAGARLRHLIATLHVLTLALALCATWMTGGIYSATISWLALTILPSVLAYSQRGRILGLALGWVLILGIYGFAILGSDMPLQIRAYDLSHWSLMISIVVVIFGIQLALLFRLNSVRKERMQHVHKQRRELRQLTKNLQHIQQQKDLFVASVSHELRTPMNAILGLADLLHDDDLLDHGVRSKIEDIQQSGEHMLSIINDLLDHAQMQTGRLQVVQEPFNLHDVLLSSFHLLKRRAETKPLGYMIQIAPNLPHWIVGDSHRLTQILVNLLGNAIKFTDQGSIELQCNALSGPENPKTSCVIELSVRDTGIGIAPELQHRVFQTYSQADSSIARRFGGNGLGLAITCGLVEAMGGSIGFESQVGQGSTFHVTLPCTLSPAPASTLNLSEEVNSDQAVRILIADDNPLNRQIVVLQLRRHLPNALVTEVGNGLQAFEAVRDGDGFDVILMDLLMPEMDGQTSTQKIRSELPEPQCATPIIALTANADKDELARCLEVGMNESMLKPFNRNLLIKRVLSYVA
jgi:signal transduction histidine kinase/CheY-like chemotaxis protein